MTRDEKISVTLNGEAFAVDAGTTVEQLLASLKINARAVVVEVNMDIVPRERCAETVLEAGAQVEIVHFVGGG
jgi:thiamine biosynthesis protein ThiS